MNDATSGPATPPEPLVPPTPLAPPGAAVDPTVPEPTSSVPPVPPAPAAASGIPAADAPPAASTGPAAPRPQSAVVASALGLARRVGVPGAVGAAAVAAITYVAAWLFSLIVTILTLVTVTTSDQSPDWGWAFEAPAQLVGLAVGGTLTLGATVMGVTVAASTLWVPLLITAVIVAGIAFLSRRDERTRASDSRGVRWARSAVTGLALALLVILIAAVVPIRFQFGGGDDPFTSMMTGTGTGSSVSFAAFLGALILGTVAAYLARASVYPRTARATSPVRRAIAGVLPAVGAYVAVASVLITVGVVVWLVANDGANALISILLWLPTVVLNGLGVVNLVPAGVSGSALPLSGMGMSDTQLWMPSDFPIWGTAVILAINLALIVGSGIVLALSRKGAGLSTLARWGTTIVAFAVVGVVASVLGSITIWTSLDTSAAGESLDGVLGGPASGLIESVASMRITVGLAAWTFIVFAVLGALVEAAAVYLAPSLIPFLPASLVARASRLGGAAPVVAQAAGPVDPSAGAPGAAADGSPAWASAPGSTATATSTLPATDAPATAAPGTAVPPVAAPMSPERKKKVRLILILVGAAIAVIIAASITISVVNNSMFSPKNQVESYLDSVVDGDATAALDGAQVDSEGTSRALLTDEVLGAAERRISEYSISEVTIVDDIASVTAEVTQDGQTYPLYFELVRSGSEFVVFDSWSLKKQYLPTIMVQVPELATSVVVNGTEVAIADEDVEYGMLTLAAFPGEYVFEMGDANEYLAAEPQTTFVAADTTTLAESVTLTVEPTEAFAEEVGTQIEALVAECAARGVIESDDCPLSWYAFGDTSNVVWTVATPATFEILDYGDGEWFVQSEERGEATLSYTRTTTYSEPTNEVVEVDFSVTGMVEMVDGKPVYTYGY